MDSTKSFEYGVKMGQSAHGLQNYVSFISGYLGGDWQATTTFQDVHDAFEYKRNFAKLDIESCPNLTDWQKERLGLQSDCQIWMQERVTNLLLGWVNRLR